MPHQFGQKKPTRVESFGEIGKALLSPQGRFLEDDAAFKAGFRGRLSEQGGIASILKNRALADQTRSFMSQRKRGIARAEGNNLTDFLVTGDITGQGTAAIRKENRQGDLIEQGVGAALGRNGQPVDLNKASILGQAGGNKPLTLFGKSAQGPFNLGSGDLKNPEIKDAKVAADVALMLKRVAEIGKIDAQTAKITMQAVRLADGKGDPATGTSKLNYDGVVRRRMAGPDKNFEIIQFGGKVWGDLTDEQRTIYVLGQMSDLLEASPETQSAILDGMGVPDKDKERTVNEGKAHVVKFPKAWALLREGFDLIEKHPSNQLPQTTDGKERERINEQMGRPPGGAQPSLAKRRIALGDSLAIPGQAGPPGPTVTTAPSQSQRFFEGRQQQRGLGQGLAQGGPIVDEFGNTGQQQVQPLDAAIAPQREQVFDRMALAQDVGQEVFVDEEGFAYVNIQGTRKFLGDENGQKVRAR